MFAKPLLGFQPLYVKCLRMSENYYNTLVSWLYKTENGYNSNTIAGGLYDCQNFDQVKLKITFSNIILKNSYISYKTSNSYILLTATVKYNDIK